VSAPATFTDPAIRTMDDRRLAARAAIQAVDAIGREIARQRSAGAPDAVLAALDGAMRAIPMPAFPESAFPESAQ
jgi:hypothetical protein